MLALVPWFIASVVADPQCRDSLVWLKSDAPPHGTPAEARELETWLAQTPELDRELMTPASIDSLNERNRAVIGAWRDPNTPPSQDTVDLELNDRLDTLGARVQTGELVTAPAIPVGESFDRVTARVANARPVDRAHLLVEPADLRCVPSTTGLFKGRIDPDFDRNQCSRLHPGDLLRVQRETDDGWIYVRAGHGVGWLYLPTLTPPLTMADQALLEGPRVVMTEDLVPAMTANGELFLLRLGSSFPAVAAADTNDTTDAGNGSRSTAGSAPQTIGAHLLVPTLEGLTDAFVLDPDTTHLAFGHPPLTRRQVLSLLFARLTDPYGWGGTHGFRDCSALLLDTFAVFGVKLGRHSGVQALAGAEVIDTAAMDPESKLVAIRSAHSRGLVFLYMPGHIMVYLGDLVGRPYAISAISEYLLPCPEGGHQTVRIDRVDVTDLARGEGTERTSFLERISRLSVFGSQ